MSKKKKKKKYKQVVKKKKPQKKIILKKKIKRKNKKVKTKKKYIRKNNKLSIQKITSKKNSILLKVVRLQNKIKNYFSFSFNFNFLILDKAIQSFFQGIDEKINEYKIIKKDENRRIKIGDILFTDYFEVDGQKMLETLGDTYFDNWKNTMVKKLDNKL